MPVVSQAGASALQYFCLLKVQQRALPGRQQNVLEDLNVSYALEISPEVHITLNLSLSFVKQLAMSCLFVNKAVVTEGQTARAEPLGEA